MSLGMEVSLFPGDIVLHRDPAPPMEKGTAAPTFWPMSIAELLLQSEWMAFYTVFRKNIPLCFLL